MARGQRRIASVIVGAACASFTTACLVLTDLDGFTGGPPDGGAAIGEGGASVVDGATADAGPDAPATVAPTDGAIVDPTSTYESAVRADAPIAYYRFEAQAGTVASDAVAGRDGVFTGTVGWGEKGVGKSRAVRFDGATTSLSFEGAPFAFSARAPFTIELWFRPDVVDDKVRRLVERGSASGAAGGYALYFTDTFIQTERKGATGNDGYASAPAPTVGVFHHVVFAYDGTSVKLYFDGGLAETANGLLDIPAQSDPRLRVGDIVSGTAFFKFMGIVDELAIYDKPLTAARVAAHFAAGGAE